MAQKPKTRLFINSFRVPNLNNAGASGGLVVALSPFFNGSAAHQKFDEIILLGMSDDAVQNPDPNFRIENVKGIPHLKRWLLDQTPEEKKYVYGGYLNSVDWPLRHGLIDKIDPESAIRDYVPFRRFTDRFARALAPHLTPKDVLKTEDYHLGMLPDRLRSEGFYGKIGHFIHTPVARISDFHRLPNELKGILQQQQADGNRALLACDLIGFQRQRDLEEFNHHIGRFGPLPQPFDIQRALLSGRSTKLGVFPASIDVEADAIIASIPMTDEERKAYDPDGHIGNRLRIQTAGRRDYTKGTPETIEDITAILRDPDFVRQVQITQGIKDAIPIHSYIIGAPSRAGVYGYDETNQSIEAAHAALIAEHGEVAGTLKQALNREMVLKGYRGSVGAFFSARDGFLLGAFEHQVAQSAADPYPVVVSQEIGAADFLPGAIKVNPFDRGQCQAALKQACTMSLDERRARHAANMAVIREQPASKQIQVFLDHLISP